jgi:endoglucanase
VGDAGVIDAGAIDLPNSRLISRSIDNRIGAFTVLEALRRYSEQPGSARVVAVATAQEEIAYRGGGAGVCASSMCPEMAIVVDVTFATDHPPIEMK